MNKVNNKIRDNFKDYTELKINRKTVLSSPIDVSKVKQRHPTHKLVRTPVLHKTFNNPLELEIEYKIENTKDFKFKLFCSEIFDRPFFRYDSSGATHRNNDPEIPLIDQQVDPPHFHEYNKNGIEIAYKTKALKSTKELKVLEDINNCVMHFCEESNLRYKANDYPEIIMQKGEFGFTFDNVDPLRNVTF